MEQSIIETKVFELFNGDDFLNDGFDTLLKDQHVKKAVGELIYRLVQQEVMSIKGPIRKEVEKVVELVKLEAFELAEKIS